MKFSKVLLLFLVSTLLLTSFASAVVVTHGPTESLSADVTVTTYSGNLTNFSEMADVNVAGVADGESIEWDAATLMWIPISLAGIVDTNASTACAGAEYLAGNGSCVSISAAANPFDQTLNITDNVTFANLTVTNNITADWIFANISWASIADKFITAVDNIYLYMSGTNLTLNETKLNLTITSIDTATNNSIVIYIGEVNTSLVTFVGENFVNITGDDMTGNLTNDEWFNGRFNWTSGDNYTSFNGYALTFNISKLETIYYNASSVQNITGNISTSNLSEIQTYNNIPWNISEVASDFEFIVNFTNVTSFNQLIIRYQSGEEDEPHTATVEIWHYGNSAWESYGTLPAQNNYHIIEFGVYDSAEHISTGVVQVRISQDEGVPAKTHLHNFDWVTIAQSFGTPAAEEVDPDFNAWLQNPVFVYNINATNVNFTTTGYVNASYFYGNGSFLTGIINATYGVYINTTMATFVVDTNGSMKIYVDYTNASMKIYVDEEITLANTSIKKYADETFRFQNWDNFTGIPTATPSDGDTTHLSTADQIYDIIISLIHSINPFDQVLNTTSNVTFANLTVDSGEVNTAAFFGLRLGNSNRFIKFGNPGSDVSHISVDDNDVLAFGQEDSFNDKNGENFLELMRIEREGGTDETLVGINNTNPQYNLDVGGDAHFSDTIYPAEINMTYNNITDVSNNILCFNATTCWRQYVNATGWLIFEEV